MDIELRRVAFPNEASRFLELDRKIFRADAFTVADLLGLWCYWLLVDKIPVGSVALRPSSDGGLLPKDLRQSQSDEHCLYIAGTGILPEFRGKGLGEFLKQFEERLARLNDFKYVITRARKSNVGIISLNKKFGFHVVATIADGYKNPTEDALVQRLIL